MSLVRRDDTCKFGAACRLKHIKPGEDAEKPKKKVKFSKKEIKAYKAKVAKEAEADGDEEDAIDKIVRGFLMVRIIPREQIKSREPLVYKALGNSPFDMESFAYDTGAGEGISTLGSDFVNIDTSESSRNSVSMHGPTVGAPTCEGRGPSVYTFK